MSEVSFEKACQRFPTSGALVASTSTKVASGTVLPDTNPLTSFPKAWWVFSTQKNSILRTLRGHRLNGDLQLQRDRRSALHTFGKGDGSCRKHNIGVNRGILLKLERVADGHGAVVPKCLLRPSLFPGVSYL